MSEFCFTKTSRSDCAPRKRRKERETAKEQKREQKRRTMETSFVVSAAFWAPVVTESQNDMAVFLAIRVWTEMVADFCDDDAASRKEAEREKIQRKQQRTREIARDE